MHLSTMGFRCWVPLALSGAVVHILISLHSHVAQCIRVLMSPYPLKEGPHIYNSSLSSAALSFIVVNISASSAPSPPIFLTSPWTTDAHCDRSPSLV